MTSRGNKSPNFPNCPNCLNRLTNGNGFELGQGRANETSWGISIPMFSGLYPNYPNYPNCIEDYLGGGYMHSHRVLENGGSVGALGQSGFSRALPTPSSATPA